jgi:DNA-binding SARP family transcriptional activator
LRQPPPKSLELLCYLLIHRSRWHARRSLCGLLWPDEDPESAKRALRQALWKLNSTLVNSPLAGAASSTHPPILLSRASGWLSVNSEAVSVDIDILEEAHSRVSSHTGQTLSDADATRLDAALLAYSGELLSGWHNEWCLVERVRLQEMYVELLHLLMGYCEARQIYSRGIAYGRRALSVEPVQEATHRQLMRLFYAAGDRVAAISQFQECVDALAHGYGVPPSAATTELYRGILRDALPAEPLILPPLDPPRALPVQDPLAAVHERLGRIQATLDVVLHAVGQRHVDDSQPHRAARRWAAPGPGQ